MASEPDVCKECSDNFIVNNKVIKCELCKLKFHLVCVGVKDSWQKFFSESPNICWFCSECKDLWRVRGQVQHEGSTKNSEILILNKEVECANRELLLTKQLVDELKYTTELQKTIIRKYEEQQIDAKTVKEREINTAPRHPPQSRVTIQQQNKPNRVDVAPAVARGINTIKTTTITTRAQSNKECQDINNTKFKSADTVDLNTRSVNHNKNTNSDYYRQNDELTTGTTERLNMNFVRTAVMQAQQANIMNDLQDLEQVSPCFEQSNQEDGWKTTVNRRNRRFMVGNADAMPLQTVPKRVALHVSRLSPNTKPEDLRQILIKEFPEALCEAHQSKHPQLYASVKVTINQINFKKAWRKEVWPKGALVSRFLQKKRIPSESMKDPVLITH